MDYETNHQELNEVSYKDNEVSILDWVGTTLIGAIPCVGIILYIVWAFGTGAKKSKANYCKASLIITATGIVLSLVMSFMFKAVYA